MQINERTGFVIVQYFIELISSHPFTLNQENKSTPMELSCRLDSQIDKSVLRAKFGHCHLGYFSTAVTWTYAENFPHE